MARRQRSGLGVLARRAWAGWAVALQDHHPVGLARAGPACGLAVHKHRRAFHVGLVPGELEPEPVMEVPRRGILAGHSETSLLGQLYQRAMT